MTSTEFQQRYFGRQVRIRGLRGTFAIVDLVVYGAHAGDLIIRDYTGFEEVMPLSRLEFVDGPGSPINETIDEFYKKHKGKRVRIIKPDASHYDSIGILGGITGSRQHCSVFFEGEGWRSYEYRYLIPLETMKVQPLPLPG